MTSKRLLTLLAAASGAPVIGLTPAYAEEDSDRLSLSSEESSQIAALESDDEFGLSTEESSQVAALDESSSDEGLAGRPGDTMEGSEGPASSIEGSEDD